MQLMSNKQEQEYIKKIYLPEARAHTSLSLMPSEIQLYTSPIYAKTTEKGKNLY